MTDPTQSGKFQLKKKDALVVSCILIIAVSVLIVQGKIEIVQTDIIDIQSVTPWVPFIMLYDPPGNTSYAQFGMGEANGFTMRFEGQSDDFQITGEFTGGLGFGYSTSDQDYENLLIMMQLNQTWEIVRYTFFGNSWIEVHLTDCSIMGDGAFLFSEAENRNVWINDVTGTMSDYSIPVSIGAGETENMVVRCGGSTPRFIGAGYNMDLMGEQILINVSLSSANNDPFTINYEFSNSSYSLDFNLFADAPITENPYETEGVLVWFG